MTNPVKYTVNLAKDYYALRKWRKLMEANPILQCSYLTILGIFDEPFYASLSADARFGLMRDLYNDILENLQKPNPILAMRERLCNYTRMLGRITVVQVGPGHIKAPFVSGELYQHVEALMKADPEFAEDIAKMEKEHGESLNTPDKVREALGLRMRWYNLWTRVYTSALVAAGDKCIGEWPKLYMVVQFAFEEYRFRQVLKLPQNLKGLDKYAEGIGEFMWLGKLEQFILDGYEDPRGLWEARWEENRHSPCPYKGMAF